MTDPFKRIAHEIEDMSDAKPRSLTKTRAHRVARARLKSADRHIINEGIDAYETEQQEADDVCGDGPHCCECGDGEGCTGCFFCERGEFAPDDESYTTTQSEESTLTMDDIIEAMKHFEATPDEYVDPFSLIPPWKPMPLPKIKPPSFMPEMGLMIGVDPAGGSRDFARVALLGRVDGGPFMVLDTSEWEPKAKRKARLRKARIRARIKRRGWN